MSAARIGLAGWTYPPWRGVFYPEGWAQRRELEYASRQVGSIEINGTFYSLQKAESFEAWRDATPEGFVFSVKGPRFITHIRRLRDVGTPLANFYASGVLRLGEKLGPMLWQLPPSFKFEAERVEEFLKLLPRNMKAAARLAGKHDEHVRGRASMKVEGNRKLRHAMEVRNESFECAEFLELLRKYDVAVVVADTSGKWPLIEEVTSDFVYVRLHGEEELYASGYTDEALKKWKGKIGKWRKRGLDVYVYFDNDVKVRAPFDAMKLAGMVTTKNT